MIPIYQPYKSEKSIEYAKDALESNWISSQGKYLDSCKELFKSEFDYKYCIFTNNGTTACHLLAEGLKFKYPKIKNLVVPNNVYVAAWNSFKMSTDYNFIFLEPNLETWNADYSQVGNLNPEDTAFLIVHNVGNVVNVPELKRKFKNFIFIEDACEGLMGKYEGAFTGSESFLSAFSFFGNKNLTSGEGGVVVTKDEETFKYLNSIKNQGAGGKSRYIFERLGYNYRMTNIQAAILQGQLEEIRTIRWQKQRIFNRYLEELKHVPFVAPQATEHNTEHANWIFAIKIIDDNQWKKDLEISLFDQGIQTRPMFPPVNYHKHYHHIKTNITNAKILYNSCIMLPSYPDLTNNQISFICDKIKNFAT
jgi:perosamine synthetase